MQTSNINWYFASGSYFFLEPKAWTDLHFTIAWQPPLLCSRKHSRLYKLFKDSSDTRLWLIFGELVKPGCFPTSYTVVKEASCSWGVPALEGILVLSFYRTPYLQAPPCFALSHGLCWDSCSVLKPHSLTKVQLVVGYLKGFPGSTKIRNLSSNAAKSKFVISWGRPFAHQTSDLVFREDTEPSSKGESVSHGMRDRISIGCFNFQSFSGPEMAVRKKDNTIYSVHGLKHLKCTSLWPLN